MDKKGPAMTDHTPLLRDALERALPAPTADRVLHALANDPEVVKCVRGLLDRRLTDLVQASFDGSAGDDYLDVAATEDAATLFGEPDE